MPHTVLRVMYIFATAGSAEERHWKPTCEGNQQKKKDGESSLKREINNLHSLLRKDISQGWEHHSSAIKIIRGKE